jgi:hypothetical protein
MNVTALTIARAFVDTAKKLPAAEIPALADAAAALLGRHGLLRESRTFPALVERVWKQQEGVTSVRITTRTGNAGHAAQEILKIVQEALKSPCVLEERADPRVLGGLMLLIGDERFDATLRSSLTGLASRITQPILTP